jgi:hypothetical protein
MHKNKLLLTVVFLIVSIPVFSQNNQPVLLKWKLKPNEVISYKTTMEEANPAVNTFDMSGAMKAMGADSANVSGARDMMKKLSAAMKPTSMVTRLTEKRKDIIDIELTTKNDNKSLFPGVDSTNMMADFFMKMANGVMLRGSIHDDGTIASFYTKTEQKNIIALFFELPGKAIKQGDSWPLSVNLVTADQNFKCDSSYHKNEVTAIRFENINGDRVVTLKYDIVEFIKGDFALPSPAGEVSKVPTTMKMTFQGLASFSIENGKWLTYNGLLTYDSTGIMQANSKQNYALVEEK